jgi:predicted ATP-grasp superfamily ATP-dependent carboligase
MGLPAEQVRAKAGVGWLRLLTDIPTALSDLAHGTLSLGAYFKSLRATRVEAVFSWDDPIPFLAEMVFLPYHIAKRLPSNTTWRNPSQREHKKQKAVREPEGNFNAAMERIAVIAVRRRS